MNRSDPCAAQSLLWSKFALLQGARFNVEKKAAAALTFSTASNRGRFAVPSKLVGTSRFQENIAYVLPRLDLASRNLRAHVTPDGRVAVGFGIYTLGFVQKKHECWVRPLVEAGPCLFDLLQVTGGTKEKPTYGVNICIHNLAEAIQACASRMELDGFAQLVA
jgi:hypothetical protein